jgi:hypothetical protein
MLRDQIPEMLRIAGDSAESLVSVLMDLLPAGVAYRDAQKEPPRRAAAAESFLGRLCEVETYTRELEAALATSGASFVLAADGTVRTCSKLT